MVMGDRKEVGNLAVCEAQPVLLSPSSVVCGLIRRRGLLLLFLFLILSLSWIVSAQKTCHTGLASFHLLPW